MTFQKQAEIRMPPIMRIPPMQGVRLFSLSMNSAGTSPSSRSLVLTLSLRSQRAVPPPSRITIRKAVSAAPPARKVT